MQVFLKIDPHLAKRWFFCFNGRSLEMMKNAFYFMLRALLVPKYLNYCPNVFVRQKKDPIKKVTLRIYKVTEWEVNNCNTHIAQHLNK